MAIRLAHQSSAQQNAMDRAQWQPDPLTIKPHRQLGYAPVLKMLAQHHLAVMLGHVGLIKLLLDYGDSVRDLQKTGTFQSFLDWAETYCQFTSGQKYRMRGFLTEAENSAPNSNVQ